MWTENHDNSIMISSNTLIFMKLRINVFNLTIIKKFKLFKIFLFILRIYIWVKGFQRFLLRLLIQKSKESSYLWLITWWWLHLCIGPLGSIQCQQWHRRRPTRIGLCRWNLFGKAACFGGVVEHFVVEDGEVQCESESDGVGGLEFPVGDTGGWLVRRESAVGSVLVGFAGSVLGDVPVVVSFHLVEEDFGFGGGGGFNEVAVD